MESICIDNLEVDEASFYKALHIKADPDNPRTKKALELLKEAKRIARPKAIYKLVEIDEKGDNYVIIEGSRIDSSLMRKNLDSVHVAISFVVTSGVELEEWVHSFTDSRDRLYADSINLLFLRAMKAKVVELIKEKYLKEGTLSEMNPGSLPEQWDTDGHYQVFDWLGPVEQKTGCRIATSQILYPLKSVSGICFASDTQYVNCEYCPKINCPSRRADKTVKVI